MTTQYSPGTLGWWMDERRGELGLIWNDVANEADVAPQTIFRAIKGATMRTTTRKGIERALHWEPGSIDRILSGGEPAVLDRPDSKQPPRSKELDDLYELAEALRNYVTELEVRLNALSQSSENRQAG